MEDRILAVLDHNDILFNEDYLEYLAGLDDDAFAIAWETEMLAREYNELYCE